MGFFDRENIIAQPGFSRWLVPPAALAIHLCIGQIYAYSVFLKPLQRVIGITGPVEGDWELTQLTVIFSIALVCLGASAAVLGKWVERVGPRTSMFASACCFAGGFAVAALGVSTHQIWLIYLGHGVLGGIGLGLGYISPVSTLMKWFPDRPGMATGMAIMGFGGGAMIASPLSGRLLEFFATPTSVGLTGTFLVMGGLYFALMMFGMVTIRIPAEGWQPEGFDPAQVKQKKLVTSHHVLADRAIATPQFWLLFLVLMFNVSAGIGILGIASVMIQEMFSASVVGAERAVDSAAALGFVGLLSLFNMLGRFFWSSVSDKIGRKNTYTVFFVLGAGLFCFVPMAGQWGSIVLFVIAACVIMTMYGGGFATIPAYLRDMFGTRQVGAIHGRILLAWSLAAVIGPTLVSQMREYQIETLGIPAAQAYSTMLYVMAGLLVLGLVCNLLIKKVNPKFHDSP